MEKKDIGGECSSELEEILKPVEFYVRLFYFDGCNNYYDNIEANWRNSSECKELEKDFKLRKITEYGKESKKDAALKEIKLKAEEEAEFECKTETAFGSLDLPIFQQYILKKMEIMSKIKEIIADTELMRLLRASEANVKQTCYLERFKNTKSSANYDRFIRNISELDWLLEKWFELYIKRKKMRHLQPIIQEYGELSSAYKNNFYFFKKQVTNYLEETKLNVEERNNVFRTLVQIQEENTEKVDNLKQIQQRKERESTDEFIINRYKLGSIQKIQMEATRKINKLISDSNAAYVERVSPELHKIFFTEQNNTEKHGCLSKVKIIGWELYGQLREIKMRTKLSLAGKKVKEKTEKIETLSKETMLKYLGCFFKYLKAEYTTKGEFINKLGHIDTYLKSYEILLEYYIDKVVSIPLINNASAKKALSIIKNEINRKYNKIRVDILSDSI